MSQTATNWFLRGWTRKLNQFTASSDPLDRCVVHGRWEVACMNYRWERRIKLQHPST